MLPANKMLIGFCKYLFCLLGEVASIILLLSSWLLQHLANFWEEFPKSWLLICRYSDLIETISSNCSFLFSEEPIV
jgi:hypothetical protein